MITSLILYGYFFFTLVVGALMGIYYSEAKPVRIIKKKELIYRDEFMVIFFNGVNHNECINFHEKITSRDNRLVLFGREMQKNRYIIKKKNEIFTIDKITFEKLFII